MKNHVPSTSAENSVVQTDKMTETLNDSEGHNYSQAGSNDMSEVNSIFSNSSSSKEGRRRKRPCKVIPKCVNTDYESVWTYKKRRFRNLYSPEFLR